MKRLLISIIFLFLNPRLYANDLPKEIYGSYQFHSTAGRNVIGVLTITKDYVSYGNNYNGFCIDSYKIERLPDNRNYPIQYNSNYSVPNNRNFPNNQSKFSRDNIFYQTYKLIMDNPSECDHILQISIQHFIEDPIETNTKFFLNTPKDVEHIVLVTYKDGKFTGSMTMGYKVKE